ncbi:C39 family peptidase [Effusibacillus consociatus]|uniref:C39 family peptidase n=1 Tax=Effusibacillus consociatus TaxID=1117041 RepID=A0ABV9Q5K0_9BACL
MSVSAVTLYYSKQATVSQANLNQGNNAGSNGTNSNREGRVISGVPTLSQYTELPTGCEATTISMLLGWTGIQVTKEEVARTIPKEKVPVYQNGKYIGGNPNAGFVGDPFTGNGFGVLHLPVMEYLNQYLPNVATNLTGTSFENILWTVNSGRPVMVWITRNLAESYVSLTWNDEKGNRIQWRAPQHTVLLIGYSHTEVIVNDPETGGTTRYPRELFQKRWIEMGRQAVTVAVTNLDENVSSAKTGDLLK